MLLCASGSDDFTYSRASVRLSPKHSIRDRQVTKARWKPEKDQETGEPLFSQLEGLTSTVANYESPEALITLASTFTSKLLSRKFKR